MEKYSIGLDIGTASIGWAVVDDEMNIIRRSRKNLMGVRLFESGKVAADRRLKRNTRRRLARRRQRIELLRSLLESKIINIDENFFRRLDNSFLWSEDKDQKTKNILFEDESFSDKSYHDKYPTIYHLRNALVESEQKEDIRLIYLALHHMTKYRGNFLHEDSNFSVQEGIHQSISNLLFEIDTLFESEEDLPETDEIIKILLSRELYKKDKESNIIKLFPKELKKEVSQIVKAFLGYKANYTVIFKDLDLEDKIQFSLADEYDDYIFTDTPLFQAINHVYSNFVLNEILKESHSISEAMIKKYQKHSKDLESLKRLFKKPELKHEYRAMFKISDEKLSYSSYINSDKDCSNENLLSHIDKILTKNKENISNNADYIYCKKQIDKDDFLKKLRTKENIGIPYQLHKLEMEKILEKQSKYHPILKENKDKIISILTFRIPYYVGPLVTEEKSKFAWLEKRKNEKIYPWNYKEVIDLDKTAEKFIKRMTNKCTYLPQEDVLPKESLLYSEFVLLNELNKVKIGGKFLSKDLKRDIIRNLFMVNKTITIKGLKKYLNNSDIAFSTNKGGVYDYNKEITGTQKEDRFASSLSSYIDMCKIFGINYVEDNKQTVEKIIEWLTIYNDKSIIRRQIELNYPDIDNTIITKLLKKNYSGWARLSAKLLDGIKSDNINHGTIISILREENFNFMEIINKDDFGFKTIIDIYRQSQLSKGNKISYSDIKEIPTSPANKKGIWQAVKIVDEIISIMTRFSKSYDKVLPERIYIEMAREDGAKRRTTSRRKKLEDLYKSIKNDSYFDSSLMQENNLDKNNKIDDDRLYLYLTQNGKCMYTGLPLDINKLSTYHIDHIIPQSIIKDDSLANRVLVTDKSNMKKSDQPVSARRDIPIKAKNLWESLFRVNLISKKKYYNLKKTVFKESDYRGFINRQLVETRQISKYVMNLFKDYNYTNHVVSVKAELSTLYRQANDLYKIRNLNDLHHAHDAYIACVVGKHIFDRQNKYLWSDYLKESTDSRFGFIIGGLLENGQLADKVAKILQYKNVFVTKKLEENSGEDKGGFWKSTIYSKDNAKITNRLPLGNKREDTLKYGCYTSENKAYSVAVHYKKGNKEKDDIIGIPIQVASLINNKKTNLLQYLEEKLGTEKITILKDKILTYQLFEQNGSKFNIASDTYLHTATQLFIDKKFIKLIYNLNKTRNIDIIEDDLINKFYRTFIEKIDKYYHKYESICKKMFENEQTFYSLNKIEKIEVINKLLNVSKTGSSQINLKEIGCPVGTGIINSYRFDRKNMIFIDQSITGFYEKKYKL